MDSEGGFPRLPWAHSLVEEWFVRRFGVPTEPQAQGWPHIRAGRNTLISAPTGSGKTLAAFLAGIMPGMRVVAINDRAYTSELLHDALKAATKNDQPIRFLVVNDDYYKTCSVNYHGGERYPHLVRVQGKPDLLDDIAKPLAGKE